MLEPKIINTIDAKFSIIEDKLRNSFQSIKEDKKIIEERISAISKKIDKINGKEELGELRAYFQKEINFLKEEVSKNSEITSKMDSKFNKANIKNEVERELGPGFNKLIDKKFRVEVEKSKKIEKRLKNQIIELEKEFNLELEKKEEKINKTLKEIENSFKAIEKDFEKKIENSEEKNLEEIKNLRKKFEYLKRNIGRKR